MEFIVRSIRLKRLLEIFRLEEEKRFAEELLNLRQEFLNPKYAVLKNDDTLDEEDFIEKYDGKFKDRKCTD